MRLNLFLLGIVKVNFSSAIAYSQLSPFPFNLSARLVRLATLDLVSTRIDKQNAGILIIALQLHKDVVV